MNKSKKVLLLALSLATSAALFAACGGGENGDTSSSNESVQSSASVGSSEEISGSFDYESWMSEMLGSGTESISVPTISTSETTSSEEISLGSSSSILEESSSAELSESSVVEESSEEVSSEIVNSEVISSEIVSSEESSSEEIVGEQVATQAEWNAIFAGSLSATNVTANVAMVGEESCIYGWERESEIGFIKVADGKLHTKSQQIYAYDWDEPGVGAESGEESSDASEMYYYAEDGKYYLLLSTSLINEGRWHKLPANGFDASQATGAGIVNMLDLPSAGYEELYTVANFDSEKGVYVYEWTENDPDEGDIACSLEIKIADGKIAALAMARAWAIEDNGVVFTTTEKTAVVFTYGNAEITVPEYNEEKPENSSSATSEVFSSEVFSSEAVNSEISSEEYSESASSEWVSSEASSEESSEEEIVGEQVEQNEWAAAFQEMFAADNVTIHEVFSVYMEEENGFVWGGDMDGTIKIANGIMHETMSYVEMENNVYYEWTDETFVYQQDGTCYELYRDSIDTLDWVKHELPEKFSATAGYVLFEGEGLDEMVASYDQWTFDEEKGEYSIFVEDEYDSCTVKVKIVDGKVYAFTIRFDSDETQGEVGYSEQTFVFTDYGTTEMSELPYVEDNGGEEEPESPEIPDVDGEQVADEAAWDAAWDNTIKARNITVTYTSTYTFDGITETEYGVGLIADNKWYAYDYDDTNGYAYTYMGEVDGKVYEWTSKDGENWEVEERYVDIEQMTSGYVIVRGLNEALDFSTAQYVDGYYVCETDWATFNIKIAGGYVVEITMLDDTETISYKMAFGGAEIGELPALPTEEVIIGEQVKDATEWNKILVNTDTQTNFTYTADGRIEREDGQIAITTEYVEVDNGNVYVEREQMVHSGSGSATGITACYYQGYVNGVAYEWRDVGDGEWYVNQIEYVDGGTLVKLLGLEDLDFATATFDSETGAYVFETDGAIISVKIVESLIRAIELSTENMFVEYTVVYGNASVELPPIESVGGGSSGDEVEELLPLLEIDFDDTIMESVVGEQVTQDELREAIERTYAATNFVLRGDSYIQGGKSLYISHIADGKMRTLTRATYMEEGTGEWETTNMYQYSGNVDGTNYVWISTDGTIWECALAEEVMVGSYSNGQEVFSMMLDVFLQMDSSYNETSREYYIDMSEEQGVFFSVRVVDGYVKTMSMKMVDGMYINYVVDYDCAEVGALPPVTVSGGENGGDVTIPEFELPYSDKVDAMTWEKALISLSNTTNFTANVVDSIVAPDYSVTALINMQIADNKGYGVASVNGKEEYSFTGNVDGKNYEWYSEDGKTWECEYMGDAYDINGASFLAELVPADIAFEKTYFNDEIGGYVYDISETEYVVIGIAGGQVSYVLCYKAEDYGDGYIVEETQVYVLSYGDANVGELPPVENVTNGEEEPDVEEPKEEVIGEQVTKEEWAKIITEAFAADNATIEQYISMNMEDDGYVFVGEGKGEILVADGVIYDHYYYTVSQSGAISEGMYEGYGLVIDGRYCEFERENEGDWEQHTDWDSIPVTVETALLGVGDEGVAEVLALYDQLTFDEATGVYSVFVNDEYDPYTMEFVIYNGQLYSYMIRFEDETGYSQEKYVFADFGNTVIGEIPDFSNV